MDDTPLPDWKPILDAIVGARHGGQIESVLKRLHDLDARHPHVAEIAFQIAWTLDTLDRPAEAVAHYERALALGLEPNEHANALVGLGNCLRLAGQGDRAVEVLDKARARFPDNAEFAAYLALALHDTGRHAEALRTLMDAMLDTTEDIGLTAHQRALRYQAGRLG